MVTGEEPGIESSTRSWISGAWGRASESGSNKEKSMYSPWRILSCKFCSSGLLRPTGAADPGLRCRVLKVPGCCSCPKDERLVKRGPDGVLYGGQLSSCERSGLDRIGRVVRGKLLHDFVEVATRRNARRVITGVLQIFLFGCGFCGSGG